MLKACPYLSLQLCHLVASASVSVPHQSPQVLNHQRSDACSKGGTRNGKEMSSRCCHGECQPPMHLTWCFFSSWNWGCDLRRSPLSHTGEAHFSPIKKYKWENPQSPASWPSCQDDAEPSPPEALGGRREGGTRAVHDTWTPTPGSSPRVPHLKPKEPALTIG